MAPLSHSSIFCIENTRGLLSVLLIDRQQNTINQAMLKWNLKPGDHSTWSGSRFVLCQRDYTMTNLADHSKGARSASFLLNPTWLRCGGYDVRFPATNKLICNRMHLTNALY